MSPNNAFAARLRVVREQAGLTQQALADAAGLSQVHVARLETGTRQPGWETVQALADALGVSTEDLRSRPPRISKKPKKNAEKRLASL
jgi:transcriptional regulator with XRE-family HTH domain